MFRVYCFWGCLARYSTVWFGGEFGTGEGGGGLWQVRYGTVCLGGGGAWHSYGRYGSGGLHGTVWFGGGGVWMVRYGYGWGGGGGVWHGWYGMVWGAFSGAMRGRFCDDPGSCFVTDPGPCSP